MKLTITNEAGETATLDRKDYVKLLLSEFKDLPPIQAGDVTYEPNKIIDHIVKKTMEDVDIDPSITDHDDYQEVIERVREDVQNSKEAAISKKEEAARKKAEKEREKEEARKKAEEEAKQLALRQEAAGIKLKEGADAAADDFKKELESLKDQLPDSIQLISSGDRTAIRIDDASEEQLATTLGFLVQKGANNEWLRNQVQFWIGDIVNGLVAKGVYKTQKEAGDWINKNIGQAYSASAISYYAKMADRTPVELRNVQADPTAYLAVANMKLPKKGDKESDADFKKRLDTFKAKRQEIQEKLSTGELTSRKDVVPLVENVLIECGLKERKDPNAMSVSDHYKIVYHTTVALEHLLDTHEENAVVYRDGETLHSVSKEELEKMRDESIAFLNNLFYSDKKKGITLKDYAKGYVIEKKKSVKAKGKDGAEKVEEEVQVKVYPEPFFEIKSEEESEGSEG